ncbi:MAG: chromate transporter [Treponema sp.]|nr:chromate transporter [Treponema sp.]
MIDLFIIFLKMGCVTFGGGYAMMPVLEREIIGKRGWITMDEALDYYAIAQVTPGVIAVNMSTFIGCKRKGAAGGVVATIGFVLPGVTLVTALALCAARFAGYPPVQHAFTGVRIAAGALILSTVAKLCAGFFPKKPAATQDSTVFRAENRAARRTRLSFLIFLIAFSLSAFGGVGPAPLVMAAGLAGFLLYGGFFSKFLKTVLPRPKARGSTLALSNKGQKQEATLEKQEAREKKQGSHDRLP